MSTYKDAVEYFKSLAIANVDIAHTDAEGNKKFFRLDMAEFYSGTVAQLPSAEAGPFMVLFNYITDFSRIDCVNQKKQFRFMILQAYSKDNWNAEEDELDFLPLITGTLTSTFGAGGFTSTFGIGGLISIFFFLLLEEDEDELDFLPLITGGLTSTLGASLISTF